MLETCCKTILDEQNVGDSPESNLIQLMKLVCEKINLNPKKISDTVPEKEAAKRILGNLANIAQGMAELRNLYGNGHGKNKNFKPLHGRYAKLAAGAVFTAVIFMLDTYNERNKTLEQHRDKK